MHFARCTSEETDGLRIQVVTSLDVDSFGKWEESKFAPEEKFLEKIKAIKGVSQVCSGMLAFSLLFICVGAHHVSHEHVRVSYTSR